MQLWPSVTFSSSYWLVLAPIVPIKVWAAWVLGSLGNFSRMQGENPIKTVRNIFAFRSKLKTSVSCMGVGGRGNGKICTHYTLIKNGKRKKICLLPPVWTLISPCLPKGRISPYWLALEILIDLRLLIIRSHCGLRSKGPL